MLFDTQHVEIGPKMAWKLREIAWTRTWNFLISIEEVWPLWSLLGPMVCWLAGLAKYRYNLVDIVISILSILIKENEFGQVLSFWSNVSHTELVPIWDLVLVQMASSVTLWKFGKLSALWFNNNNNETWAISMCLYTIWFPNNPMPSPQTWSFCNLSV